MAQRALTPEMVELIAARFKALAEPTRLTILNALRSGEKTVTELMAETGLGQANLSKHLQLLHNLRFVVRRKEGLNVHYRLADEQVFQLCDLMCGRIEEEFHAHRKLFSAT
jgi:ArsR family transcriptional regulator